MRNLDRTTKMIIDTLTVACDVPICEICVLDHDDKHFKAYVNGTSWYSQRVYDVIMQTWGVEEKDIDIKHAPESWFPFSAIGYTIEVTY